MLRHQSSPSTADTEETRAFLQARVALFWKVIFVITLIGSCLGLAGAIVQPGMVLVIMLAETALAAVLWGICRRGERSIRFSRVVGRYGFVALAILGAFQARYLVAGFVNGHAIASSDGVTMADGYVSMMELAATVMLVAIRAALIPSPPRRTIFITALIGAPQILVSAALVPSGQGGLVWRALDSAALPWLPAYSLAMWGIAISTCAVISRVIYGLRADVREAARFGQYILERKIGEGAMGMVYRATHAMLRRPAAIKLLLKDRVSEIDLVRFEREVQLTSGLAHPNTISIFDYGRTAEGVFYYVMEYLDGLDLQHLVEESGPVPPARAIHILAQICGALAEAHAVGLIHRDIKPANIVLTERPDEPDVVKVVDFGLVKQFGGNLTQSAAGDAIVGTPLYMAPEAISRPDSVDGRSDLYAVGAVAYFLLTGQHVFQGATVIEVCSKHMLEAPVPPSQRLGKPVPPDLEAIVLACLAKEPDARPASAAVLRASILACVDASRIDLPAARAWWNARRASQKTPDGAADSTFRPATMAIDLGHRGTLTSTLGN